MKVFATRAEVSSFKFVGARYGMNWEKTGLDVLFSLYVSGYPLESICSFMERPAEGVISKLEGLGLIGFNGQNFTYECRGIIPRKIPLAGGQFHQPQRANTAVIKDWIQSINPGIIEVPTQTEKVMTIEHITFINGKQAKDLSDDQIFDLIAQLESQKKRLSGIENKPKKLLAKIDSLQKDIDELITYVDSRE